MDKQELTIQYIMRFGADKLPPMEQMPAGQQNEEFFLALLDRALREDRPATDFITIETEPGVLY